MSSLSGKKILLGISGGIAAYKTCELVRRLRERSATVHVVMTKAACEFITPLTLQALSGNPVHINLFDLERESKINHIALADIADLVLVAPATADLIAKITHGICDDLLTTLICAARSPVVLCPSMNVNMWTNPVTQENLLLLKRRGLEIIDPTSGTLACGYEGMGRLPEAEEIITHLQKKYFEGGILSDLRILITAGPTWEPIDAVRHITSPASGKTGYALAERAAARGAKVTLISGPTSLSDPKNVEVIRVTTAAEMAKVTFKAFPQADITIATAAVSDFRPQKSSRQKTKKNKMPLQLDLVQNEDILAELGVRKQKGQILVGFAAETGQLTQEALRKLKDKNLDLICANDISREGLGFAADKNQITLFNSHGSSKELPILTKQKLADILLDEIEETLKNKKKVTSISEVG